MLITFTATDDTRVLLAARQEARQNFEKHRRFGIDTPMQINHAVEVANILRHNIVQGARDAAADENAKWGTYSKLLWWTGGATSSILEMMGGKEANMTV